MAEFQEVCRQALRRAKMMNAEAGYLLDYIGLYITPNGEALAEHGNIAVTPEVIEHDIMEWAAAHPEPVYPSWNEAWKQLFPNAINCNDGSGQTCPCVAYFMPSVPAYHDCGIPCADCLNEPIPADIAEKLGIKPLEG